TTAQAQPPATVTARRIFIASSRASSTGPTIPYELTQSTRHRPNPQRRCTTRRVLRVLIGPLRVAGLPISSDAFFCCKGRFTFRGYVRGRMVFERSRAQAFDGASLVRSYAHARSAGALQLIRSPRHRDHWL